MLTINLQRVRAVGETWTSETCFLCERHEGQCGGGTQADDQADKAHRSQVSIQRGTGDKRRRTVR